MEKSKITDAAVWLGIGRTRRVILSVLLFLLWLSQSQCSFQRIEVRFRKDAFVLQTADDDSGSDLQAFGECEDVFLS